MEKGGSRVEQQHFKKCQGMQKAGEPAGSLTAAPYCAFWA